MEPIPFNRPPKTGLELQYIAQVIESGHLTGDGAFTRQCHAWLEQNLGTTKALLTHSCTGALEMAALLCGLRPGDEVIMPSFTFVSTANAFALRGAVPVFVDIREDTLNLDETRLEAAISARTRAIVPVHYAGVGCDMDAICAIAAERGLKVIEDAAQGFGSTWRGKALGTLGDYGTLSFHGTKNIVSGEGGALLTRSRQEGERAEVTREKGTDRSRFLRGEVDKYTWQELGSSYLPSDLTAAFLLAQFEHSTSINARRVAAWSRYHSAFAALEASGKLRRPTIPDAATHNGHIYYLVFNDEKTKARMHHALAQAGIQAASHYVSLHDSPAGKHYGRACGSLPVTDHVTRALLRLPMYADLSELDQDRVIRTVIAAI